MHTTQQFSSGLKIYMEKQNKGYRDFIEIADKPSLVDTFLTMAFQASKRSTDYDTQHGCVITSSDNRVLSTGYNGFPRDIEYRDLPNSRPVEGDWLTKYDLMLHSERNALAWCEKRPINGIAYVTGEPCLDCTLALYQHGISKVYYADLHGSVKIDDRIRRVKDLFLSKAKNFLMIPVDVSCFVNTKRGV